MKMLILPIRGMMHDNKKIYLSVYHKKAGFLKRNKSESQKNEL